LQFRDAVPRWQVKGVEGDQIITRHLLSFSYGRRSRECRVLVSTVPKLFQRQVMAGYRGRVFGINGRTTAFPSFGLTKSVATIE
jgi:hypothetical protein